MEAAPGYNGEMSVFFVGKFLTIAGVDRIFGFNSSMSIGCFGPGGTWAYFSSGAGVVQIGGMSDQWSIVEFHLKGGNVGVCAVNGVDTALSSLSAAPIGSLCYIGAGHVDFGHTAISAFARFSRFLSGVEIYKIRSELSYKTGIPITIDLVYTAPNLCHYTAVWHKNTYLNASSIPVADGEKIQTITSQDARYNNLQNPNAANQASWDADGGPLGMGAAIFDGVTSFMYCGPYETASMSIFLVVKTLTPPEYGDRIMSFHGAFCIFGAADNKFYFYNSGGAAVDLGGNSSNWTILELHVSNGSGIGVVNGVETIITGPFSPLSTDHFLNIGSVEAGNPANAPNMAMASLVRYSSRLSNHDIKTVRSALSLKTGIPIA
jgi:hypothetical protein